MPRSIPDAPALIAAAVKYLEQELLPTLSGYHRFQTRVTVNVLNTIRRELDSRDVFDSAERNRVSAITGHEGPLDKLNYELCEMIRTGAIDLNDPVLRDYVKQSLEHALAINNPKWTAG
jgi:hypothetical protein